MRINTNLTAMNTFTQYTKNNNKIADSVEKLSSGYAINSAADNAAGLAISEKMRAQIRGLEQASVNSQDAISLIQTAEGGLNESTEILQRMRELAVQSANDTNENEIDREALQDEFSQLQEELNNIANTTTFNKKNLLDGSLAKKQASTANLELQNAGLSVSLGNVAAGSYKFEVLVKTESAEVTAQDPDLTATSTNKAITATVDPDSVEAGSISQSSLGNGNYDIEAAWNADTKEMVFTAKGDNGQTFTATASEADLNANYNAANGLTLSFGNGETEAFEMTVTTETTFSTSNDATMETVAKEFSDALTVSASGGVDHKDATYALYATMTGAEDVKLEAGMDSVTFSNGVSVSFDELTVSDVTISDASGTGATYEQKFGSLTPAGTDYDTFTNGSTISYANGSVLATQTAAPSDGDLTVSYTAGTKTLAAGGYSVVLTDDQISTLEGGGTLTGLEFKDANGDGFKIDIKNTTAAHADDAEGEGTNLGIASMTFGKVSIGGTGTTAAGTGGAAVAAAKGTATTTEDAYDHAASEFEVQINNGEGLTFQIGANQGDELVINVDRMDAEYLGVASADVLTRESATDALTAVDKALNQVASQRAYLGAMQNRLDHKIANLDTSAENLTAAEGQIRDVDMAKQMTEFTNANILSQAATAMLAQANSLPQNVLSLIG